MLSKFIKIHFLFFNLNCNISFTWRPQPFYQFISFALTRLHYLSGFVVCVSCGAALQMLFVLSEDIFPCKDCGIWYRSERNLQAHLMYYCASRQKQPAAASSPPQDKPKESYPNERVCPFPQCNKSCPSASSLEIHMRTHSGMSHLHTQ